MPKSPPAVAAPLVVTLVVCAVVLPGCAEAPTYRGKTAAYWNKVLLDRDEDYRVQALTALGEIGPAASDAAPNVKRLIADKQSNGYGTRLQAATVWWKISGNPNATVVPRLSNWLRDGSEGDAQFAAEAITRIGPPARDALPALRERHEAVTRKLGEMDEAARASSPTSSLRQALVDAISAVNGGA